MARSRPRRLTIQPQDEELRSIADRNHSANRADEAPRLGSRTLPRLAAPRPGMQLCEPPRRLVAEVRFWNEMFGWY